MVTGILACILTAALLSCAQPTEPVAAVYEAPQVAEEEPEEPAPEAPQEEQPVIEEPEPWQAEDGTLYLFYDHAGGELYRSEQPAADRWASRTRAYRQMAERDGYVFVAGRAVE